jgi:hypothetical protein
VIASDHSILEFAKRFLQVHQRFERLVDVGTERISEEFERVTQPFAGDARHVTHLIGCTIEHGIEGAPLFVPSPDSAASKVAHPCRRAGFTLIDDAGAGSGQKDGRVPSSNS